MTKAIIAFILLCGIASCVQPTDSDILPDGELITHVTVLFVDTANNADTVRATFVDEDGAIGPRFPIITGATLRAGHTYAGSILLEDRSKDPIESINEEIEELANEHQFFYTMSSAEIRITDQDENGLPLGLSFMLTTSASPGNDTLNVVLSHYQEKGAKDGTTRSDDSDIDIDFPITIIK